MARKATPPQHHRQFSVGRVERLAVDGAFCLPSEFCQVVPGHLRWNSLVRGSFEGREAKVPNFGKEEPSAQCNTNVQQAFVVHAKHVTLTLQVAITPFPFPYHNIISVFLLRAQHVLAVVPHRACD